MASTEYIDTIFPSLKETRKAHPQEIRLWAIQQTAPNAAAYNVSRTWQLQGSISIPVLKNALQDFIESNACLRHVFSLLSGSLVVNCLACENIENFFSFSDVSGLPRPRALARAIAAAERAAASPFNLQQGPLFRILFCRIGNEEHLLTFVAHHIIFDGHSFGALVRIIKTAIENSASRVEIRPVTSNQATTVACAKEFWQHYLHDCPLLSTLPPDYTRMTVRSFKGERMVFEVGAQETAMLRNKCIELHISMPALLLTIFGQALYCMNQQRHLVIALPVDMRSAKERAAHTIGFLVNTLPVSLSITGDLAADAKQTARNIFKCLRYKNDALNEIIDSLGITASPGIAPLMQTMFNYFETYDRNAVIGNAKITVIDIDPRQSMYDASLVVEHCNNSLTCTIDYDTNLYKASTILEFLGILKTKMCQL